MQHGRGLGRGVCLSGHARTSNLAGRVLQLNVRIPDSEASPGQVRSLPDPVAAGKPAAAGPVELAAGVNSLQHLLSGHRSELPPTQDSSTPAFKPPATLRRQLLIHRVFLS